MFKFQRAAIAAGILTGLFAVPAHAQVPAVNAVTPAAIQVGTKATLTVNGGSLQGATQILVTGTGVTSQLGATTNAGATPFDLTVAPDAPLGVREIRVVTPRGVSNAGRILVSSYPQIVETEPNNTVSTAQKLEKSPVGLTGLINGGEDVDAYTFSAQAGETFVFRLVAAEAGSGLDGFLGLYDARGKLLQTAMDAFDRDPRLVYTFKATGPYVVVVRDSMYRGGANFFYSLSLGRIPAITTYQPRAGRRGTTVNVAIDGVNLGDVKTVQVPIPAEGDTVTVYPQTPLGPSENGIVLQVTDANEAGETEPNNTPNEANSLVDAPSGMTGKIDQTGDVDVFRFKPAATATLQLEVFGRRINSRIDSYIRVMDASGKTLQENDDADGKDSRIVMGVTGGTEYLIEVRGMGQRAAGDVYYRLQISPPQDQDFRLTLTPDEINVGQGGSSLVTVAVQRLGGFAGPINLRVEGLPAGMTASPGIVPAGQGSAQLTLSADTAMAQGAFGQLRVVGTATIGEKPRERSCRAMEIYKQPLAQDNQNSSRPVEMLLAAAMPPTPYSLNLDQKAVSVKRGTSVMVKLVATRQMGQTAQINITAAGQPSGVTPTLANIAANANEATITLAVGANAPLVTQNIIFTGNLNNNVQVAPALTITITE